MITRRVAHEFYLAAQQNIPTPSLTVVRLCETIGELYKHIDELESDISELDEVLEKAIRDHCGCLGGLQAP